jgi:hypothetical protein
LINKSPTLQQHYSSIIAFPRRIPFTKKKENGCNGRGEKNGTVTVGRGQGRGSGSGRKRKQNIGREYRRIKRRTERVTCP